MTTQPPTIRILGLDRLTALDGGESLVRHLEETLIPNLLASGDENAAEDLAACCVEIRRLADKCLRQHEELTTLRTSANRNRRISC